ncbi:MAG TPA: DUF4168 domain-containing protein [Vitreimonas sp.]|jgi:hypothetical protein|nr:DUF4168 domain-containing protein [Vitreimonas sp.]
MTRSSFFILAYALLLGAAGPLAACASNVRSEAEGRQSPLAESRLSQSGSAQAQAASPYSDAQVRAFVAAREEIQRLTPGQTAEAQAQNQRTIGEILQRNSLAPDVYNAIDAAARTDQALANRISAASGQSTTFSDAQLQAFVSASAEIDPLNRQIASASAEQRTQIGAQIRAALQRYNLDIETYNAIAARAQTDQALGQRIAQLRAAQPAPPPAG